MTAGTSVSPRAKGRHSSTVTLGRHDSRTARSLLTSRDRISEKPGTLESPQCGADRALRDHAAQDQIRFHPMLRGTSAPSTMIMIMISIMMPASAFVRVSASTAASAASHATWAARTAVPAATAAPA